MIPHIPLSDKFQQFLKSDPKLLEIAKEMEVLPSATDKILESYLTVDPDLIKEKEKIKKLAARDNINVLIIGETGTGKELFAKALHGERKGHFVAVNTAGIPDTLLESEFFGVMPGAFTGAIARSGYLEEAVNGTLFLDEIGDMPILLQCKLLRVLEERKARRLGSNKEYGVNCRFVSATNNNEISGCKNFRRDLYYRLAGCVVKTKPLRDRREDIQILADNFNGEKITATTFKEESWKDKEGRHNYNWPGNVRELKNYIESLKIL